VLHPSFSPALNDSLFGSDGALGWEQALRSSALVTSVHLMIEDAIWVILCLYEVNEKV